MSEDKDIPEERPERKAKGKRLKAMSNLLKILKLKA